MRLPQGMGVGGSISQLVCTHKYRVNDLYQNITKTVVRLWPACWSSSTNDIRSNNANRNYSVPGSYFCCMTWNYIIHHGLSQRGQDHCQRVGMNSPLVPLKKQLYTVHCLVQACTQQFVHNLTDALHTKWKDSVIFPKDKIIYTEWYCTIIKQPCNSPSPYQNTSLSYQAKFRAVQLIVDIHLPGSASSLCNLSKV